MKIIIPMSGMGSRFVAAGYDIPKPLIEMDGIPIIEHVVNMFPGETDFIFICNSKHLAETNMKSLLLGLVPQGKILEIPPHKKGPVYAVQYIEDYIDDEEEVIVNYCDFSCYWDYKDFLNHTRLRNSDGAIPAYKGFHPHMLGNTNYAFMRESNQWMLEIKEKEPFTNNRMHEYASTGTYYFKKGSLIKKYFKELMDKHIHLNGEYYISLVYNLLVDEGLKVSIYNIQHMLQWGTPQDVEEYNGFSKYFKAICVLGGQREKTVVHDVNLIPSAGRGIRFSNAGFTIPKPLIPVSGKAMIVQAANYLPLGARNIFVCLREHMEQYPLIKSIIDNYPDGQIVSINEITEGQACTCAIGLKEVGKEDSLLIAACDNGMLWDKGKYLALILDPNVDAIIWSFKNHPSSERNPHMYGWIKIRDTDVVTGVSVKKPISSDPRNDHAIVGTFYFRKTDYFLRALERLLQQDKRINGEFYVDSCMDELVAMGLNVKVFEIDHYVGWGTPDDYRTFIYWQSFFHKVSWHPYRLEKDPTVRKECIEELDRSYKEFTQEWY